MIRGESEGPARTSETTNPREMTDNLSASARLHSTRQAAGRGSFFSFLWTPGQRQITLWLAGEPDEAAQRIKTALASSEDVVGRVAGRGVKIEIHPRRSNQHGVFAPVFYGLLQADGEDSRLVGHFQLHPVARLYVLVWIGCSVLLALAMLVAGGLRATPESTVQDALPFLLPALLPFLGLGLVRWQRRRGQADEAAIRAWLTALKDR